MIVNSTTTAIEQILGNVIDILNEGPSANPKLAMTLAVATPIVIVALCVLVMACRVLKPGRCCRYWQYWRKMPKEPKGLEPDQAIGEHQDEHFDIDSADEETHDNTVQPQDEYEVQDVDIQEPPVYNGQRECCSKMAAVLQTGSLEVGSSHEKSPPTAAASVSSGTMSREMESESAGASWSRR